MSNPLRVLLLHSQVVFSVASSRVPGYRIVVSNRIYTILGLSGGEGSVEKGCVLVADTQVFVMDEKIDFRLGSRFLCCGWMTECLIGRSEALANGWWCPLEEC